MGDRAVVNMLMFKRNLNFIEITVQGFDSDEANEDDWEIMDFRTEMA